MSSKPTFTIGELAARACMTPDALRYYERLGVIARVKRTSGGFRVYSADVLERLYFIKQAQRHALTLAEIRELLRLDARGGPSQCRQVRRGDKKAQDFRPEPSAGLLLELPSSKVL